MKTKESLLALINSPSDLRELSEKQLPPLAQELRKHLITSLNQCGGHFAGNLGSIELTVALHYLYNTPADRLVWDVGHQAYPHKVLTGRRDRLNTIKQPDGLAPFPKREESPYDTFGTGHSSTSISAALGMAEGFKQQGKDNKVVAIIGDGGLTGGMAFEALNHAGALDTDLLVILNDNEMSISENVGALTSYFARILSGKMYVTLREGSKKVLEKMAPIKAFAKRTETHMKGMVVPGTLFEEMGFNYFGPIDGHDLTALVRTLRNVKDLKGPRLIHVITNKGKGYAPAEADPIKYHAVKPGFHPPAKTNTTKKASAKTYSQIFGDWLCYQAAKSPQLMAITPAMREGSGMVEFQQKFPQRFFDVSIAEQHSVTFAAGLACEGLKPVVAIYSTFLQRAYDQLIHDVAIQNLDVTFAIDRAGLVGADGPTHAGSFDLGFLRMIPNLVIMAPADENECWQMLTTAYQHAGPAAVRYPRGGGNGATIKYDASALALGKAKILRQGTDIVLLAFGSLVNATLQAGEQLNATVVNMRFIKPIDEALIINMATHHDLVVTVEENAIMGGAGSAVAECLAKHQQNPRLLQLGLPDKFIAHGNPQQMLQQCGLDAQGIIKQVEKHRQTIAVTA